MNLSIIIPHFNSSDTLKVLLESIPDLTEIQVIVVDDYSEEMHLLEIDKLKQEYNFEFYKNDGVKSAGTCRNIGLEKAKGKWLLFADSDDFFTENFYESLSKYFKTDNEVVFFYPTSIYIDTGEKGHRHKRMTTILDDYRINTSNYYYELYFRHMCDPPICKLIKNSFIKKYKINFDEVLAANDVMFSLKVGHNMKKFVISEEVIYVITTNFGSLTMKKDEILFDARFYVGITRIRYLEQLLSKEDYKMLRSKLFAHLIIALNVYGIRKFLKCIRILNKKKIRWFYLDFLNPLKIIQHTISAVKSNLINRKYS